MPKTVIDYDMFCQQVDSHVQFLNNHPDVTGRYVIAQLEEAGMFHVCLMRPTGEPALPFEYASLLMGLYYKDMSEEEFVALTPHFVSGKTEAEDFDAVPIHVLYEFFCTSE